MMKILTVYYSHSGNTRKIAEMIQKNLGGDIAEIKTKVPYTGSYNSIVEQGKREIESGFSPAIEPLGVDVAAYDTVFIGTPVWWYTYAPAIKSFLENTDLSGKTVFPFATNGGWVGHTLSDFKKGCPDSDVRKGLDVYFSGSSLRTKQKEIDSWIEKAGG